MVGRTLNHYKIVELLGKGGMGEVWIAEDKRLGRRVALKVLPATVADDPDRRGRFEREARAIAALNHPNIVTIHSVEEAEGIHFLTMELVVGDRLTERIGERGFALDRFFDLAIPLADAIHAAHRQGITHRDLKPDNVMVTAEGRVKVLDFGLAKLRETSGIADDEGAMATATVTAEGRIVGTIAYMSPEQAEGKPVDERSDIFSLGILLYEMATGRRPFSGDTPLSTMSAILKDDPVSVTELKHQLPRHLGRVIANCLEKSPDRRYQTALDVRNELERLRKEVESGDSEISQIAATQAPRPSRASLALGIVVGALVLGALVWALFLRGDDAGGRVAAPTPVAELTLGVIGFENLSDPADAGNLGRMLMSLIATDLAESGGLGVVSTAKVLAAYRQAGGSDSVAFDSAVAGETARAAGADVMLVGQILASGEMMILTAELVDVASGNTLGSVKREAGSSDELFALAGSIAADVRDRLGVGANTREFDLAGTLTDSTEAYRQYVAGELALHTSRWTEAAEHFEAALRLDPTFAWAYYRLGMAESWGAVRPEGQARAYERGAPYIERLPARWQTVYTATRDIGLGNVDSAVAALERLLRTEPDIPDAYNNLGEIQTHFSRHLNHPAATHNFETALAIDPTFKVVFFHLLDNYMLHGDEAAIERLIDRSTVGDDPDHPWIRYAELVRLYIRDRPEEVVRYYEQIGNFPQQILLHYPEGLARLGEWDRVDAWIENELADRSGYLRGISFSNRAWGAYSRGRFDAARADHEVAASLITGPTLRSIRLDLSRIDGHLNELQGRIGAAEAAYRSAIEGDPYFGPGYWALGRFLSTQGRLEEARQALTEFERGLSPDPDATNHCWAQLLRGEILLGEGDAAGAREAVSRLRPESCWIHDQPSAWLRAESHELEDDFAAAAEAWRDVIEPAHPRYPCAFSFEIPAWYRLGRAQEQAGNVDRAREAYRRFLEAWGAGDAGILDVTDARARLAALGG